uniref:Reverse transcriptase domain-containing protein n=1 Tax=Tanacetum cinerariifolium TaxID=118510 RepID=A0A6L2KP52_TANCI|nr:reverse transcriptase domain-containing protein [Tanacetum cinerariifolium]
MHTRASNFELVEHLAEPERTLNQRLRRRKSRFPFEQRNNPPQQPRIVYMPILDINYFRHFLITLQNLNPMDDEPMWAVDRVVALTPSFAITIPDTANEFAIKGNHLTLFKGNQFNGRIKTDSNKHVHEFLGEMLRNRHGHNLSKGNTIKIFYRGLNEITQEFLNVTAGADLCASINLVPYSLYAKLSLENLKPTQMSVRLADRSFQYPIEISENMLVEVGKLTFPADFVILKMEEDSKVPLILGRYFLHTADVVTQVKQKQLNLKDGTERMIFHMDSAIKHSYSNDDTCFSIDIIAKS